MKSPHILILFPQKENAIYKTRSLTLFARKKYVVIFGRRVFGASSKTHFFYIAA